MLCKCCGKDTVVIGYQHSEQLDVEPAKYFVSVTRREKRVCRGCAAGVSAALLPVRIIDKGLVGDRVVIDTLIAKYSDHRPLYRQSVIFERETGLSISRATMDGWVMSVGELLTPVTAAMGRRWVQLAEHRRNSDTVARTIAGKRRHARGLRKARETEGGKSWEFLSPHFDTLPMSLVIHAIRYGGQSSIRKGFHKRGIAAQVESCSSVPMCSLAIFDFL